MAPGAARAVAHRLPESIAAAVAEFITGPLLQNPRRVGHELARELAGAFSARRGAYRVIYELDDTTHTVRVLLVEHRSDAYRRR